MRDSRETHIPRAFVVGYPIKHSRSPIIHGYWLNQLGLEGSYEKHAVAPDDFTAFVAKLRSGDTGYVGGNVTIPHKEAAARLADHVDPLAEELGAANTLWLADREVHATNTDGVGFISNLDAERPGWDATEVAVVLGAGGASRAILQSLRDRGFREIHVLNRTVGRARELVERFGKPLHAHPIDALPELLPNAGLFVNTTSLGMDGNEAPVLPFELMRQGSVVTDIVYVPLQTPFLDQAKRAGLDTVDGLGMLLHQALPGFEKWFGVRPQVTEALRQRVLADIEALP
ncbi:MAG: shikimate dehydrogenase [Rhizobium sp.]|nr:shikimate dehydrogenase [Rhizobium sp.]